MENQKVLVVSQQTMLSPNFLFLFLLFTLQMNEMRTYILMQEKIESDTPVKEHKKGNYFPGTY